MAKHASRGHLRLYGTGLACGILALTAACSGGSAGRAPGPSATASPDGPSVTPTKGVVTSLDPTAFGPPGARVSKWFPLQPGNQWVRTGATNVGHHRVPHQVTTTVKNVARTIHGVTAIAVMDQDTDAGQVTQQSLDYMATDKSGNVWLLGGYTEQLEAGRPVAVMDAWLAGAQGGKAGILVPGTPNPGTPPYSIAQPSGEDPDVAQVVAAGTRKCVPFGCFRSVLVVREGKASAPDNEFKYYAPEVGQILNTPRSASQHKDLEKLVNFTQLSASGLRQASAESLKLDAHARSKKPDVFGSSHASLFPS